MRYTPETPQTKQNQIKPRVNWFFCFVMILYFISWFFLSVLCTVYHFLVQHQTQYICTFFPEQTNHPLFNFREIFTSALVFYLRICEKSYNTQNSLPPLYMIYNFLGSYLHKMYQVLILSKNGFKIYMFASLDYR